MRLRVSGILLHISSLPSKYGIGDLGPEAYKFVRFLAASGQSLWQFLPLNPTSPGIGNSPYSSPSAFAGNTLFISPEVLRDEGFVSEADIGAAGERATDFHGNGNSGAVDYDQVHAQRDALLRTAFTKNASALKTDASFKTFVDKNHYWLDDFARFETLKQANGGAPWTAWPERLARRDRSSLAEWDAREAEGIQRVRFEQYLFYRQWSRLRNLCARLSIRLVGDLPIYVTHDSVDVWANARYFRLDETGQPTVVAGVPPDYFSPTGQRWGNPLYDWDALAGDGFRWWIDRLSHNLAMFDMVRLDHFRGFSGYWEVPAAAETAVNGRWVDAPGYALFSALARRLLSMPIIAEDLGVITPDVRELQRELEFPGMVVLQFGFSGRFLENPHTPFMHKRSQVVYTGTHDNAPVKGWFREQATREEKDNLAVYAGHEVTEESVPHVMTRLALASVADMAVVPVQDILGLDMESRMNTPSTVTGNWTWRLLPDQCTGESLARFRETTAFFGRDAGIRKE